MAMYSNRAFAFDHGSKQRSRRALGPVGQRLASVLRGGNDRDPLPDTAQHELETAPERFAVVRRGYHCTAVDDYVAALERELAALDRELAELRGSAPAADEVANEIKRIGEQTSAVLMAAHEQREEILRRAREEAERCVVDARATASTLTAECEQRLRELRDQTELAQAERDRLVSELRTISGALATVADSADSGREP
jgi:CHASE3 domain sensor protein